MINDVKLLTLHIKILLLAEKCWFCLEMELNNFLALRVLDGWKMSMHDSEIEIFDKFNDTGLKRIKIHHQ